MTDLEHDEAMARVRAADPATGSAPDLQAVRRGMAGRVPSVGARVRHRVGRPHAHDVTGPSEVAARVVDPDPRGWRLPGVAAAAAVALGLGLTGFYLGQHPSRQPDAAVAGGTADRVAGEAGGDAAVTDHGMGASSYPYGGPGAVRLQAGPGLSTEGGTAPVSARVAPDHDPEEFLREWARGLELDGTLVDNVGQPAMVDGFEVLTVHSGGAVLSADYSNAVADPSCSQTAATAEQEEQAAGEGPATLPDQSQVPVPTAQDCLPLSEEGITKEAAVAEVQDLLAAAEIDPAGYEFQATSPLDAADGEAMAGHADDPRTLTIAVEGSRADGTSGTGPAVYASVSGNGVSYLTVGLSERVELGEYPIISPAQAVERWSDPAFGQAPFYVPEDAERLAASQEEPQWVEPEPVELAPDEPIPFPVTEVTVTDAELVTGVLDLPGAEGTEVPAWILVGDNGQRFPVLALAEEALATTP